MNNSARLINLKNYSNRILFEKRENNLESKRKALFYSKIKKISNQKHNSVILKSTKNESFSFPFLSNSTISYISDKTLRSSTAKQICENPLIKMNVDKNFQDDNKYSLNKSSIFITEKPMINSYRKTSAYNLYRNINNIKQSKSYKSLINRMKSNSNNIYNTANKKNNNYLRTINFSDINNADILLFFQLEKYIIDNYDKKFNKNKEDEEKTLENNKNNSDKVILIAKNDNFKKTINNKIKQMKINRNDVNSYLNKTREIKISKYTSKMLKEKYKRLRENYQNKIEYYNEISKSLEKDKKLLNIKFIDKLADYIKYINSQKELEKAKNIELVNDIIKYKNEIKQINSKIKKKVLYKKNILKWIYFQIQLKEKKLTLPSYYKTILENHDTKIDKKENINFLVKPNDAKLSKKEMKRFYSIDIRSSNKYNPKKKSKKNSDCDFNSENGIFYNYEIDLKNPLNLKEINKVKNYINYPIYSSIDEFKEHFTFFDNKNISLMKYYYNLRMQIFFLNKELAYIKEHTIQKEINHDNSVKTKEKELNEINNFIKFRNNLILQLKQSRQNDKIIPNNKIKINNKYPKSNLYKIEDEEKLNLEDKINVLYNTCKLLGLKSNFDINKERKEKKKLEYNAINEILLKLKYITYAIDYLLEKFKIYNSCEQGENKLLNKLKNEIEKNHKIENAAEQKLQIEKKAIKLRNKIEERNNRIYFLPYRKIDVHKNKNDNKTKVKRCDNDKTDKIEINDYLDSN